MNIFPKIIINIFPILEPNIWPKAWKAIKSPTWLIANAPTLMNERVLEKNPITVSNISKPLSTGENSSFFSDLLTIGASFGFINIKVEVIIKTATLIIVIIDDTLILTYFSNKTVFKTRAINEI